MIERATTEKDLNSRFYQHNEGLAKRWENFVNEHNGNIDGIVNGFILEVNASINNKEKKIRINLLRQLSNKTASHSAGLLMTKNTIIEIDSIKTDE
ncbi:MAG TPA: hypothetical protein VKA10_03585 [Prolixibacteraceae bacterium]|nr:hypothetical protein [Prolixibacteraceae bacterium]